MPPHAHASSEKDEHIFTSRLPRDEYFFRTIRSAGDAIAEFYGFERVGVSGVGDARMCAPLVKGGFFEDRTPYFVKSRTGYEYVVGIPGLFPALRAYHSEELRTAALPLKLRFDSSSVWGTGRGRIEQRDEWGLLMIGEEGPVAEAEIAYVLWKTLAEGAGLKDCEVVVNAVGCKVCRSHFRSSLISYARNRASKLCRNCTRALKTSATRIVRCPEERCRMALRNAPQVLDFVCDSCKKHLRGFLEFLEELSIPYFLDQTLFLEGTWFTEFVFEIVSRSGLRPPGEILETGAARESGDRKSNEPAHTEERSLEEKNVVVAEGGRVSQAGGALLGETVHAIAGMLRLDTVAACAAARQSLSHKAAAPDIFLAQLGEFAKRKSFAILEMLRVGGFEVQESLGRDSIKSQLKAAERVGARVALIVGQKEALDGTVIVRELPSGIQETVPQDKLIEFLKKKVKK